MGSSGIASSMVIQPQRTWQSQRWKFVFTASFIGAANLYIRYIDPEALHDTGSARTLSTWGYLAAGLLVGFGTKLGNGCTSGHGICGMARLSRRSFAAVATFMTVAMATAILLSQEAVKSWTFFLYSDSLPPMRDETTALLFAVIPTFLALYSLRKPSGKTVGAAISGALFAVGLAISKMVLPSKVLGFLDISAIPVGTYDPSLATVMAAGVVISFLSYQYKNQKLTKPIMVKNFNVPTNAVIDSSLLLGSACFGVGWGLGGFCPGPALFWAAAGMPPLVHYWLPAFYAGAYLATQYQDCVFAINTYRPLCIGKKV